MFTRNLSKDFTYSEPFPFESTCVLLCHPHVVQHPASEFIAMWSFFSLSSAKDCEEKAFAVSLVLSSLSVLHAPRKVTMLNKSKYCLFSYEWSGRGATNNERGGVFPCQDPKKFHHMLLTCDRQRRALLPHTFPTVTRSAWAQLTYVLLCANTTVLNPLWRHHLNWWEVRNGGQAMVLVAKSDKNPGRCRNRKLVAADTWDPVPK